MSDAPAAGQPPLLIDGLAVRYPGKKVPSLEGVALEVAAGERVGVAGRTGAGKSTLALAAAGFIPRVVRARLDGRIEIGGVRDRRRRRRRAARAGRHRVRHAGQPAVGLEADGARGARLRAREPGRPAGRDGPADRRHAGAAGHRPPRRPRAVRPVRWRAAARRDREHRGDGHERPRPRRADRPARSGRDDGGRRPARSAGPGRDRGPVRRARPGGARADGPLPRPRPRPRDRAGPAGHRPGPRRGSRRPVAADARSTRPRRIARPRARLRRGRRGRGAAGVGRDGQARSTAGACGRRGRAPVADPSSGPPAVAADPDAAWTPGRDRPPVRISVDGLVHRYPGGVEAVRGVSLAIEPGEAVAILGQNGSGKTTLVKHLDGLLRPDAGRVLLDGAPTDDRSVAELARTVGFVFQNPDDQLFERSVEREVAFGPRNLGVAPGDIAALVTRSLAAVGLAERAHDQPVRPRPVAAQARGAGRDPGDGPGRPRARRADDRPGRRRRRADRRDHRGLPGRRPLGRGGHPRHGVRRPAFHQDRRHARRRGRRRRSPRRRCSCRPTARSSPRPG